MALLTLGSHAFSILPMNLQRIESEITMNWPAIARFGGPVARQATGQGEHETRLTGLLFPETFGGMGEYRALKQTALRMRPVPMVGLGAGDVGTLFGQVVILKVHDLQDYIGPDGVGRRVGFDVVVAPSGQGLYGGSLF